MAKKQNYGFKTPVRRQTKNISGHKVGGNLTGGECKILVNEKIIVTKQKEFKFSLNLQSLNNLFNRDISIFAIGGYFFSSDDFVLSLSIKLNEITKKKDFAFSKERFHKFGYDFEIPYYTNKENELEYSLIFKTKNSANIYYSQLIADFISYNYFKTNDVYEIFNNSKKTICFPEQFYLDNFIHLPESELGFPMIFKSCNRCQRFLPINHFNEREHLSFTNHCSTKAPCTHSNFSNYKILENQLSEDQTQKFINKTIFKLENEFIISYFWHQLECKACKKFFVNSALNPKRSSSQHREDSLRRRAFEQLIIQVLEKDWIYNTFRAKTNKEFDKVIWEKFGKACFKCKKPIKSPNQMDLDHTMPLVNLYNLDETATCLCESCNSKKRDSFPVDFYDNNELIELAKKQGCRYQL